MAKTIMIVDDEPDLRSTVRTVLEKEGFNVITAVNGDDCLKKLKKQKPDLILLDIMMPGTPLKDIVQKIKGTKIAFLSVVRTSEAEKEDLMKSKNIVDFIEKPFDINEMVEKVKKIVGYRMEPTSDRLVVIYDKEYDDRIRMFKREISNNQSLLIVTDDTRLTEIALNMFRDLEFRLACYIDMNKTYRFITQSFKMKGIDVNKFFFVDGVTAAMTDLNSKRWDNCIFLESPQSLEDLELAIDEALKKKPDILIFDSISSLLSYHDASKVGTFFEKLLNTTKSNNIKSILFMLNTDWNKEGLQGIRELVDKNIHFELPWQYKRVTGSSLKY
jgi:DNA-binding response OmpR family regulator